MALDVDLVVAGGGSGGFAAALAAARHGQRVLVVEPGPMLGGNATLAGVNTWEPGTGGLTNEQGFHRELHRLLAQQRGAVGISRTVKHWTASEPWGLSQVQPGATYADSLRRAGHTPEAWARVTFEPEAMAGAMAWLLLETGHVELRLGARVTGVETQGRRVTAVRVAGAGGEQRIQAGTFVDATAQLHLARAAGCRTYTGAEPRTMYGEPSAPPVHEDILNGVSLCFRIARAQVAGVAALPDGVPAAPTAVRALSITEYPCGDLNVNPLPIMEGVEFLRLGEVEGRAEALRRVWQLWRAMQTQWSPGAGGGWRHWRMACVFSMMGVREGPRLVARQVLTEVDIRQGLSGQVNAHEAIAVADHALDVHGQGHQCNELTQPYGVPWACLLPKELDNVVVACRGAGFSHLAASSCRLSRTMMQLGHAAGLAAALAAGSGRQVAEVRAGEIRAQLYADGAGVVEEERTGA